MVVIWDKNVFGHALENVFGNVRERTLLRIVKWSTSICHFKMLCVFGLSMEASQKDGPFTFEHIMQYIYPTTI